MVMTHVVNLRICVAVASVSFRSVGLVSILLRETVHPPFHGTKQTVVGSTSGDSDGIPDGIEDRNGNGLVDDDESNPNAADSDGDGLSDGHGRTHRSLRSRGSHHRRRAAGRC